MFSRSTRNLYHIFLKYIQIKGQKNEIVLVPIISEAKRQKDKKTKRQSVVDTYLRRHPTIPLSYVEGRFVLKVLYVSKHVMGPCESVR